MGKVNFEVFKLVLLSVGVNSIINFLGIGLILNLVLSR